MHNMSSIYYEFETIASAMLCSGKKGKLHDYILLNIRLDFIKWEKKVKLYKFILLNVHNMSSI